MFEELTRNIKLLLLDVDGVLTDGKLVIGAQGEMCKHFHVSDGLAISLAQKNGLQIGIITGRRSDIVKQRAQELNIQMVYQGVADKTMTLAEILSTGAYKKSEIAFVGDDLNDLAIMSNVALAIAPANAAVEVRGRAHYICLKSGGNGAVREAIEFILKNQGKWNNIIKNCLQMQGGTNAILSDKINQ